MNITFTMAAVAGLGTAFGAVPAGRAALETSTALGVGIIATGTLVGIALAGIVLSPKASEGHLLGAALGAPLLAGVAYWLLQSTGLPIASAAVVIVPATLCCVVILMRAGVSKVSAWPTETLVAKALASADVLQHAYVELERRGNGLQQVITAFETARGVARKRALGLVGYLGAQDKDAAAALVAKALREAKDAELEEAVKAASRLAHPDLIAPLRAHTSDLPQTLVLRARGACGDVDVVSVLANSSINERDAEDVVVALGVVALPALAQHLAADPSDALAARLLNLIASVGKMDETAWVQVERYAGPGPGAVRAAALRAASRLDAKRAMPLAEAAKDDPNATVTVVAASVLRRGRRP